MSGTLWTFWHQQLVVDPETKVPPRKWKAYLATRLIVIVHSLVGKRHHRVVVHVGAGTETLQDIGRKLSAISSGQSVQIFTGNVHIKFEAAVSDESAATLQRAEIALSRIPTVRQTILDA